jgi:hypothetical protein
MDPQSRVRTMLRQAEYLRVSGRVLVNTIPSMINASQTASASTALDNAKNTLVHSTTVISENLRPLMSYVEDKTVVNTVFQATILVGAVRTLTNSLSMSNVLQTGRIIQGKIEELILKLEELKRPLNIDGGRRRRNKTRKARRSTRGRTGRRSTRS